MPTKVLVDAWHLSGSSAPRGIGTYLRAVLPRLAAESDLELVALTADARALPDRVAARPVHRSAPGRFAQWEHDRRLPYDLARAARAVDADVVFSPADDPPRSSPRPWVQMLHDLIPLVAPGFGGSARRWRRIGGRLRDATIVCTNSHATAADATRLLGVTPERLRVIPLGVEDRFRPGPRDAPEPYVLSVGIFGPHKGFAEAFAVAGRLAEAGFPQRLAMTGQLAPWHAPAVRDLVHSSPRPDRIELRGHVDDIVRQYQRADVLIVTSRYEGFCLPALEAMACGTPVVAFANSAITETVGAGGTLVPDGDVRAMAAAVGTLLRSLSAWEDASARGIEHASTFTWDRCAHAHAHALRAAAACRAAPRSMRPA